MSSEGKIFCLKGEVKFWHLILEAVAHRCSVNKVFLEIS